jgi:hypothetical protein
MQFFAVDYGNGFKGWQVDRRYAFVCLVIFPEGKVFLEVVDV